MARNKTTFVLFLLLTLPCFISCVQNSAKLLYLLDYSEENPALSALAERDHRNSTKAKDNSTHPPENQGLSTQIENSANAIRTALEKQALEILSKLNNQTESLQNSLKESTKSLEETLNTRIEENTAELSETIGEVKQRLDKIEKKSDAVEIQAAESTRLILQSQIDTYSQELKEIQGEIASLTAELPAEDNPCKFLTSCETCVANDACGWCLSSGTCVQGDNKGPLYEECPFYDYKICSGGKDCARLKDCFSCLEEPKCGWCSDSARGINKCLERKSSFTGCGNGWYHPALDTNSECPKYFDNPAATAITASEKLTVAQLKQSEIVAKRKKLAQLKQRASDLNALLDQLKVRLQQVASGALNLTPSKEEIEEARRVVAEQRLHAATEIAEEEVKIIAAILESLNVDDPKRAEAINKMLNPPQENESKNTTEIQPPTANVTSNVTAKQTAADNPTTAPENKASQTVNSQSEPAAENQSQPLEPGNESLDSNKTKNDTVQEAAPKDDDADKKKLAVPEAPVGNDTLKNTTVEETKKEEKQVYEAKNDDTEKVDKPKEEEEGEASAFIELPLLRGCARESKKQRSLKRSAMRGSSKIFVSYFERDNI